MNKHNLVILTNEKIYENNGYFCDNIDIKNLSEKLSSYFDVCLAGRNSNQKRYHHINIKKIKIFNNLFSPFFKFTKLISDKNSKYLIVSLSPFTFLFLILLKILNKKVFLYFRSDGFLEYKKIMGFFGPVIYGTMFYLSTKIALLISCRDYILRGRKGFIVSPSQLNEKWFYIQKSPNLSSINLLYVGRLKIEKGVFSLIEIIKGKENINLTMIGAEENQLKLFNYKNLKVLGIENDENRLIKHYDAHNIFILPSYTEGHPMVLIEALSRLRPVIIFKDIDHIIGKHKGIFVSDRNDVSLMKTIQHIKENYKIIQEDMKTNVLPTNEKFINDMKSIILNH